MIKVLLVALLLLTPSTPLWAHGGGLDGYGCHNNRKQGGYHCHRGPNAGQSYSSKSEMLQQASKPSDKAREVKSTGASQ